MCGDLHDIGKNPVAMTVEGAGFEVTALGVVMFAQLTTTMPPVTNTLRYYAKQECAIQVKVMIGGAPATQVYEDSIGAEGYAPDAASAVDTAKELVAA